MKDDRLKLIELLKTLLNNNDIEIIKCVIESIVDEMEEEIFNNKET